MSSRNIARCRHGKTRVLNALSGFQLPVKLLDDLCLPFRDDDFQAIVMVKVNVLAGKYSVMVVVLNVEETGNQTAVMVIIYQRDGAGNFTVFPPLLPDEFLPDQVPDRLGTIGVFSSVDVFVKTL